MSFVSSDIVVLVGSVFGIVLGPGTGGGNNKLVEVLSETSGVGTEVRDEEK